MLMRNFIPANFCLIVPSSVSPPHESGGKKENKFLSYYFSIKTHEVGKQGIDSSRW